MADQAQINATIVEVLGHLASQAEIDAVMVEVLGHLLAGVFVDTSLTEVAYNLEPGIIVDTSLVEVAFTEWEDAGHVAGLLIEYAYPSAIIVSLGTADITLEAVPLSEVKLLYYRKFPVFSDHRTIQTVIHKRIFPRMR